MTRNNENKLHKQPQNAYGRPLKLTDADFRRCTLDIYPIHRAECKPKKLVRLLPELLLSTESTAITLGYDCWPCERVSQLLARVSATESIARGRFVTKLFTRTERMAFNLYDFSVVAIEFCDLA